MRITVCCLIHIAMICIYITHIYCMYIRGIQTLPPYNFVHVYHWCNGCVNSSSGNLQQRQSKSVMLFSAHTGRRNGATVDAHHEKVTKIWQLQTSRDSQMYTSNNSWINRSILSTFQFTFSSMKSHDRFAPSTKGVSELGHPKKKAKTCWVEATKQT